MQILIVSTNNRWLEEYWQEYLTHPNGPLSSIPAKLIVVHEEWPGGAGNGLGTLHAFRQAEEKAKRLYQIDLLKEMDKGASVSLYHTAGVGKRLYPLAAAENNNKSAVKLPALVQDGHLTPLTMLEAVIRQTALFASKRNARLNVFWGDQIFQPSHPSETAVDQPVSILAKAQKMPDEMEWGLLDLERYGLFAYAPDGSLRHLEKISFDTMKELAEEGEVDLDRGLFVSLGSFSLSLKMLLALLREFEPELNERKGHWNSDPDFWMPLTLERGTYLSLMEANGVTDAADRYDRMQKIRQHFSAERPLVAVEDLGERADWWDYGSVSSYFLNNLKLVTPYAEGEHMRNFFQVSLSHDRSCLLNSRIGSGRIKNSVLINVDADEIDVENCVIVGTKAPMIHGHYALFYNVNADHEISLSPGKVRADVLLSGKRQAFYTRQGRDGKEDWNLPLPQNPCSYEALFQQLAQDNLSRRE